uniref:putative uncharacterized protein SLC66A1L n=1 Tax=Callithrix jacchus TaxID=9483 RepID=UPI0001D384AB|nr:putative uncharacterized protein SLC66A1L [Callithrix jacchus]
MPSLQSLLHSCYRNYGHVLKVVGNNRANAANSSTDRSRGYLTCLRMLRTLSSVLQVFICQLSLSSQLFVAYRNGRVDAAVSLGFLLCWIGGDLTNFKGCYLTKQLPIQIFTTVFDMNTDIIMRSQFMYYRLKNQKNKISKEDLLKELYFCCLHWP